VENPHIGIIGVPFDGSTRGRPGARFAPRCIREQLYSYTTFIKHVDLEKLSIRDFGDVPTFFGSVERNKDEIRKYVADIIDRCGRLIVLGGDHSITEPVFGVMSERYSSIGLVVFDAHLDLREVMPNTVSSGTVMGDIIKKYDDKISPKNIMYVGIRDFVNSKYYLEKADRLDIKIFSGYDILSGKITANEIIEHIKIVADRVDALYVSFDVDSLDCVFAPGVNAPSSLGLRPEFVSYLLEYLGKLSRTRVLDITELAPAYDPVGITCKVVASCILYFIVGVVSALFR
ncbi:MAG: arginase family protein, partial [Candidatus Njordarchaeota archaeon]